MPSYVLDVRQDLFYFFMHLYRTACQMQLHWRLIYSCLSRQTCHVKFSSIILLYWSASNVILYSPRNQLCRAKQYCKTVGDRQGELHDLLEKLMTKTQKLSDSSVSLYFFSASLYLVKVLRGGVPGASAESKTILSTEEVSLYLSDFTTVTEVGP